MSGTIGLTPAGQALDVYLTHTNTTYKNELYKFIKNFTTRMHHVRKLLLASTQSDKEYLLSVIRKDYLEQLIVRFKNDMEHYPYTLAHNYITTLTKPTFIPTTKTQQSILRKAAQTQAKTQT